MNRIRCLVAVLLGIPSLGFAQDPARGFTLRGAVVAGETADPIPYVIVELSPGYPHRLTDDSGHFQLNDVPPGRYRLFVRQIGYTPIDSAISIPQESDAVVIVRLWRIGITLPAVTVTADLECRTPGAPAASVTPALAAVFDQVVENARRYDLLMDSFPHTLRMVRTLAERTWNGTQQTTRVDTLLMDNEERWPYQPGKIIGRGTGPRSGEVVLRLPSLSDFANSEFVAHHCFSLAGRDTLEGSTFIRIDFQPPVSFKEADVAGAAYLDSATYLIRYTVVRLTRPRKVSGRLASLEATSRFREIVPWIIVPDFVHAIRRHRAARGPAVIEEQRLVGVNFLKPLTRNP